MTFARGPLKDIYGELFGGRKVLIEEVNRFYVAVIFGRTASNYAKYRDRIHERVLFQRACKTIRGVPELNDFFPL